MKNNGFTLVELLATMVIVGLLVIIMIPGFSNISDRLKKTNLDNKVIMVRNAALNYTEKRKDEIKEKDTQCIEVSIEELIRKGYLQVEKEVRAGAGMRPILIDPTTNQEMAGKVSVCYCNKTYNLVAIYNKTTNQEIC